MTCQNELHTLTARKPLILIIIVIIMFTIAVCIYPYLNKSVDALAFDNYTHASNYFLKVPSNSTDKVTMLSLFANWISDKIPRAVDDLEISSRYETIRNVPFLMNVSRDINGIPSNLDLDKRNLAKDILQRNKDIASIFFVLPNGDIYMGEPYRDQEQLPRINFADREWYKGVVKNNQTYISSIFLSASINAPAIAIAVPVYSLKSDLHSQTDSSLLNGYWVGIINLRSLEDLFKSLSADDQDQFILVDHNGTEFFDTTKLNFRPAYSGTLENESSSASSAKLINHTKLETFDNFDLVKAIGNETRSEYNKINLDDQTVMFWKSINIKDSDWYVVLITRND